MTERCSTGRWKQRTSALLQLVRGVYLTGLAVLVVWVLLSKRTEMADLFQDARLFFFMLSLLAGFAPIAIGAWFWAYGLRQQGRITGREGGLFRRNLEALSRSLPARYIPGQVWSAVGRVEILRRQGIPVAVLTSVAALEMATSLTAAVVFGLLLLAYAGMDTVHTVWLLTPAVVCFMAASPAMGGRVVAWWTARRNPDRELVFTWGEYWRMLGINMLFWAASASAFLFYLRAFPSADIYGIAAASGGFMLTWAAGVASIVAPQGVGVFETSLAAVLRSDSVAGTAIILGGYRLVLLARDVIAVAAGEYAARLTSRSSTVVSSNPSGEPDTKLREGDTSVWHYANPCQVVHHGAGGRAVLPSG